MLVVIEIEGKSQLIIKEILELLHLSDDILLFQQASNITLLMDILKATQVINWCLQNSMIQIKVRKATGDDITLFEDADKFKEFLYRHLNIRHGQKWIVEQMPNDRYIALRKAREAEIKAYGMKEDILSIEAGKLIRIVSLGSDVDLDKIDFKSAIQYA